MQGAASTLVPGVHRRQKIGDLRAAHLPDDQAVGPHAQRLTHQGLQVHLPGTLHVRRAGLQPHHVRMPRTQLAGVLDEHDPLGRVDLGEQAFSSVVLPDPVPPVTKKADAAAHHGLEDPVTVIVHRVPLRSSSRLNATGRGMRKERVVPGRATGASTAWNRVPSARRTST